jgi:2-aminoethylphosphonate-pyruvate transaminase
VRDGLVSLGFELVLPPPVRSTTITAVMLPDGVAYPALHDALKAQGFVIYAGQGPLAATLFRIATMGDVGEADYRRFIEALAVIKRQLTALSACR